MEKKRNHYSAQMKFQVALEAVKGVKTINQVASEHGVHPNQVSQAVVLRHPPIYPKPRTGVLGNEHKIYPYLLREVEIVRPNQVWCADITYVRLASGFMCLVAILDWFSRHVIAWELSNTLDGHFCVHALQKALSVGQPEIFNTDQGAQFTARAFAGTLELAGIRISMDGRGHVCDNIFVERLWRTVKYQDIYSKDYSAVPALKTGLANYFSFYNHERLHQSLGYRTPAEVHFGHEKSRSTIHLNFG